MYTTEQTDLDELLSDKFQLSLGFRHRFDCCVVSFAATENLQNLNNTPDVGFQLGIRLGAAPEGLGASRFAAGNEGMSPVCSPRHH